MTLTILFIVIAQFMLMIYWVFRLAPKNRCSCDWKRLLSSQIYSNDVVIAMSKQFAAMSELLEKPGAEIKLLSKTLEATQKSVGRKLDNISKELGELRKSVDKARDIQNSVNQTLESVSRIKQDNKQIYENIENLRIKNAYRRL